mgnify:CR=1 FL=1
MGSAEFDRTHGVDPEGEDRDVPMTPDQTGDWFDEDFDSKTVKIALGGIAAGGLLVGIYAIAHRRLNKKEQ